MRQADGGAARGPGALTPSALGSRHAANGKNGRTEAARRKPSSRNGSSPIGES
jgi:hypothetical protein